MDRMDIEQLVLPGMTCHGFAIFRSWAFFLLSSNFAAHEPLFLYRGKLDPDCGLSTLTLERVPSVAVPSTLGLRRQYRFQLQPDGTLVFVHQRLNRLDQATVTIVAQPFDDHPAVLTDLQVAIRVAPFRDETSCKRPSFVIIGGPSYAYDTILRSQNLPPVEASGMHVACLPDNSVDVYITDGGGLKPSTFVLRDALGSLRQQGFVPVDTLPEPAGLGHDPAYAVTQRGINAVVIRHSALRFAWLGLCVASSQ